MSPWPQRWVDRCCWALQVLSDPLKRQIYDVYGKQGLTSGLELGERLRTADDIKAEMASLEKQKVCWPRIEAGCPCGRPALLYYQDSDAGCRTSSGQAASPGVGLPGLHGSEGLLMPLLHQAHCAGAGGETEMLSAVHPSYCLVAGD